MKMILTTRTIEVLDSKEPCCPNMTARYGHFTVNVVNGSVVHQIEYKNVQVFNCPWCGAKITWEVQRDGDGGGLFS